MISIRFVLIGFALFVAYRLVWELIRGDQIVQEIADRTRAEVSSA